MTDDANNEIECPVCKQAGHASRWMVDWSSILDAPVLICPDCGDGILFEFKA